MDGKLFNLARLKSRSKTQLELTTELLFADDTALVAHSEEDIMLRGGWALQINTSKTQVIYQPSLDNTARREPDIEINGETLKVVPSFKHLGSTLTPGNRVD